MRAPWEAGCRGFTPEVEAFALSWMRERPGLKAGEVLGADAQRLWRRLLAPVDGAGADLSWENGVEVEADELNWRQGHDKLTGFVDLEAKRVLRALEGKDGGRWEHFAQHLLAPNGHAKALGQEAIASSGACVKGARAHRGPAPIGEAQYPGVRAVGKPWRRCGGRRGGRTPRRGRAGCGSRGGRRPGGQAGIRRASWVLVRTA